MIRFPVAKDGRPVGKRINGGRNFQVARVEKLKRHGFCAREIRSLTGYSPSFIRRVIYAESRERCARARENREAAAELLGDMPDGFAGGEEKWRELIKANFGD